jgi:hypothetical protein
VKRILLLPGIGDVHWVALKLQDWLRRQGPEWASPEIHIWDIDARPRTLEYLKLIPWLQVGDYWRVPLAKHREAFNSIYHHENPTDCIAPFESFDALIGTNGNMRNGIPFKDILQGAATNYGYGPVVTADNYGVSFARQGPYLVLGFSSFGMFERRWCGKITAAHIKMLVADLHQLFPGYRMVFTGCSWDDTFSRKCVTAHDTYLVGNTTLPQFISLIQHSAGYIGWCGGNSILAQHLGVKTVVWWSKKYFPHHDRKGWATPSPEGKSRQLVLEVEDFGQGRTLHVVDTFLRGEV